MVCPGEKGPATAAAAGAVSPDAVAGAPVPVAGDVPAPSPPGRTPLAHPLLTRHLPAWRWLAALVVRLSRWTCLSDVWQLARAFTQACHAVPSGSAGPASAVVQAARRRGLEAVSSPLGWWVLVVLPGGQVAQITTFEAGRYALTLDGRPPQTFGSPEAALEMAVRVSSTRRR